MFIEARAGLSSQEHSTWNNTEAGGEPANSFYDVHDSDATGAPSTSGPAGRLLLGNPVRGAQQHGCRTLDEFRA